VQETAAGSGGDAACALLVRKAEPKGHGSAGLLFRDRASIAKGLNSRTFHPYTIPMDGGRMAWTSELNVAERAKKSPST
jgi:hypothetical protein